MHTQGPWKIEAKSETLHDATIKVYAGDFHLATVNRKSWDLNDAPQLKRDARLIAAAPKLLEALDKLNDAISKVTVSAGDYAELSQAQGNAIAAIKKAKGE